MTQSTPGHLSTSMGSALGQCLRRALTPCPRRFLTTLDVVHDRRNDANTPSAPTRAPIRHRVPCPGSAHIDGPQAPGHAIRLRGFRRSWARLMIFAQAGQTNSPAHISVVRRGVWCGRGGAVRAQIGCSRSPRPIKARSLLLRPSSEASPLTAEVGAGRRCRVRSRWWSWPR